MRQRNRITYEKLTLLTLFQEEKIFKRYKKVQWEQQCEVCQLPLAGHSPGLCSGAALCAGRSPNSQLEFISSWHMEHPLAPARAVTSRLWHSPVPSSFLGNGALGQLSLGTLSAVFVGSVWLESRGNVSHQLKVVQVVTPCLLQGVHPCHTAGGHRVSPRQFQKQLKDSLLIL